MYTYLPWTHAQISLRDLPVLSVEINKSTGPLGQACSWRADTDVHVGHALARPWLLTTCFLITK